MPELLDDVVKSLDEALLSLDAAQSGVEAALRATEYDPQKLERTEERLFRAAGRGAANIPSRSTTWPNCATAWRQTLPISMPARSDCTDWRSRPSATRDLYDREAARLSEARKTAALNLARAVMAELPALKLERAEFIVEMSSEPQNRTQEGIDQIEFWVQDQSWHARRAR